jgi:hypothetical protein
MPFLRLWRLTRLHATIRLLPSLHWVWSNAPSTDIPGPTGPGARPLTGANPAKKGTTMLRKKSQSVETNDCGTWEKVI